MFQHVVPGDVEVDVLFGLCTACDRIDDLCNDSLCLDWRMTGGVLFLKDVSGDIFRKQ